MKKVSIIGSGGTIESIAKLNQIINDKLGEEVTLVHIDLGEFHGFLPRNTEPPTFIAVDDIQDIKPRNPEPISIEFKAIDRSCCHVDLPKRKGHQRPYKYHR